MLEGSRGFDIVWGTTFGTLCFAIGFAALADWLRARRTDGVSMFGAATDPGRGLHLAWAIFALGMGGTNAGCRFIDHRYLSGVHEAFFALTLITIGVIVPRLRIVRRFAVTNVMDAAPVRRRG
jgi:hypothetical protein